MLILDETLMFPVTVQMWTVVAEKCRKMDTIPQQKRKSRLDRVLTPGDFVARVLLSATYQRNAGKQDHPWNGVVCSSHG